MNLSKTTLLKLALAAGSAATIALSGCATHKQAEAPAKPERPGKILDCLPNVRPLWTGHGPCLGMR